MRICHGLLGEAVEVEDQELQWRKPLDIVRQHARERWEVDADDIIVLAGGGGVVGPSYGAEEIGLGCDLFLFLKSALDPQAGASDAAAAAMYSAVAAAEEEDEAETVAEEEEADAAAAEALRLAGQSAADDPAFETFRCNIAEARRRLAEVRPVVGLAARLEARLEVQRLAVQAVLDNLTSHRTTCNRSMSLFLQKYQRVQERLDQNLGKVEASMSALIAVPLHPALRASGRESLADALPRERILRFTAGLQAERARLAQRLEKLKHQDLRAQALCDQAATKVHQLLQDDDAVTVCAAGIRRQHAQVIEDFLPALEVRLPMHGADSTFVLEEEKRTAGVMEGLAKLCREIRDRLDELRSCWERRLGNFLQRLREVSYIQSKVRGVERQAALLEEEINVQHNHSQQLNHLQKMPRAYQKALSEVGRRREFRARYIAQGEQARGTLARMMEDENTRRRGFAHRYGCHLPADLVRALGAESAMAPPAVVEVPDFDTQLPDLGSFNSPNEAAASASAIGEAGAGGAAAAAAASSASMRHGSDPAEGAGTASAAAVSSAARGSSTSSCSSSLRSTGVLAASSARGAAGVGGCSGSGSAGPSGSSGGSQVQARSVEELEARNHALQARVESLLTELATQKQQHQQQTSARSGTEAAPPAVDVEVSELERQRSGAQGSEA